MDEFGGHKPIFMIDAKKMSKLPPDKITELCILSLNWIKDNMLVWGRIESILVIVDMNDIRLRDLPFKSLWDLAKNVFRFYIGGGHRTLLVNSSWFLKALIDFISHWFDRETNESIMMVNHDDTFQLLLGFLPVEDIEQKFGGKKPNIN